MSTILRGVVVWVCIIIVEVLHGIARTMILAPVVGDFRARQIAVVYGILPTCARGDVVHWLASAGQRS